jgi:hypothetical protein
MLNVRDIVGFEVDSMDARGFYGALLSQSDGYLYSF